MNQSLLIWGIVLIVGFPILTIVLGESGQYLRRREHPVAPFVRDIQRLVLPPLVILLIMRQILGFSESMPIVIIVETVLGISAIYTSLALVKVVLTPEDKQYNWQFSVPNLLFHVIRSSVVLGIVAYVLTDVWKIDLTKVVEALGVGSLVFALALQETLSNLVSGFLLLADSPFKKGDWLKIDDLDAQVIDINWRSTRLQTVDGNLLIIPNGNLGNERIFNYSLPNPKREISVEVSFSQDDPPNRVKQVLRQTLLETPGVVQNEQPYLETQSFDNNSSIKYSVSFMVKDYASGVTVANDFKTRLYYAAQRHSLTMPLPIQHTYTASLTDIKQENSQQEVVDYLQSLTYFMSLEPEIISRLAQDAIVRYYGTEEKVFQEGDFVGGFYIIQSGSVSLSVKDQQNKDQKIADLSSGDFFGESVLLAGQSSLVSVSVIDDLKAIVLDPDTVADLLPENPRFAKQINELIEERRKTIRRVKKLDDGRVKSATNNGNLGSRSILGPIG